MTKHVARKITLVVTFLLASSAGSAFARVHHCSSDPQTPCIVTGTDPEPQVVTGADPEPQIMIGDMALIILLSMA